MSTLNIKNFPDALYRKLQARARAQHRSVAQEAICILAKTIEEVPPRSILELKGLGKEAWSDEEAGVHVARERDSWD